MRDFRNRHVHLAQQGICHTSKLSRIVAMEETEVHDQWARTGIPPHIFAGQRPDLIYDEVIYHAGESGGTSQDRLMYVEKQMVDGAQVWEIESKELKRIKVIVGSWPHLLPSPAALFARPLRACDMGVESKTSGRQILHRNARFQDNPEFMDPLIKKYGQEWDPILTCLYLQGYASTKRKTWANLENDYSENKLYNLLWARKFEIEKVKHIISDTEIQTMQVPAVFLCGYGMVRECFWQSAPLRRAPVMTFGRSLDCAGKAKRDMGGWRAAATCVQDGNS